MLPIHNQLQTLRRCLLEVKDSGGVSNARELYPYSMKVCLNSQSLNAYDSANWSSLIPLTTCVWTANSISALTSRKARAASTHYLPNATILPGNFELPWQKRMGMRMAHRILCLYFTMQFDACFLCSCRCVYPNFSGWLNCFFASGVQMIPQTDSRQSRTMHIYPASSYNHPVHLIDVSPSRLSASVCNPASAVSRPISAQPKK